MSIVMTSKQAKFMYWDRPSIEEYNDVICKIQEICNLKRRSQVANVLTASLGIKKSMAYRYVSPSFNIEKLKFSYWLMMNVIIGNDLSRFINITWAASDLDRVRLIVGEDAFKSFDSFNLKCDPYWLFHLNSINERNAPRCFTSLTKQEFCLTLSLNYCAFLRKLSDGSFPYVEFKLYLLMIGFKAREIGVLL